MLRWGGVVAPGLGGGCGSRLVGARCPLVGARRRRCGGVVVAVVGLGCGIVAVGVVGLGCRNAAAAVAGVGSRSVVGSCSRIGASFRVRSHCNLGSVVVGERDSRSHMRLEVVGSDTLGSVEADGCSYPAAAGFGLEAVAWVCCRLRSSYSIVEEVAERLSLVCSGSAFALPAPARRVCRKERALAILSRETSKLAYRLYRVYVRRQGIRVRVSALVVRHRACGYEWWGPS